MNISILGLGWLGLPLAEFLIQKDFEIKGSTTRQTKLSLLREKGIDTFLVQLNTQVTGEDLEQFLDSEVLVINIPPQTRTKGFDFHPKQIESLTEIVKTSPIQKIIFISSTSVYPNLEKEIDESQIITLENATNPAIFRAEQILQNNFQNINILRCGGLMGYNRVAGKYFAGKKNLDTGQIPVNYIHRDDIIEIVYQLIQKDKWGEVFNLVAPKHPTRQEVYEQNARQFDFEVPTFIENQPKDFKIINSNKIIKFLDYQFKYDNPLEFYKS